VTRPAKTSIAVLPFVNMSSNVENEYFSDGITEEIINALAKIEGLKVTSRTSAFYFKGKNIPIGNIGEELKVSTLLEGSVRLSGNSMRITAQLIDAAEDYHFWSETWDRSLDNIFEVQDEISQLIADRLREHFGHFEIQEQLVDHKTESLDAYTLFLKGRFHMNQWNPDSVKRSIELYEEALSLDAKHTHAMLGLADAYSFLATTGVISHEEGWGKCAQLTQQALSMDSELPGAYYLLANMAFFTACDFREAFNMASKAITLNPSHVESQQFLSFLYVLCGKKEAAKKHLDIALGIDPLSQETQFYSAYFDYMFENYPSSIKQLNVCLEVNQLNIPCHYVKTLCLLKMERYDEVIDYFETLPSQVIVPGEMTGSLTLAHSLKGDKAEAANYTKQLMEQAQDTNGFTADSYLFMLYGATKQNDQLFDWVEKAIEKSSPLLLLRYSDPVVNPVKDDPRYAQFHHRLFPEDVFKSNAKDKAKKALLNAEAAADYKAKLLQLIETEKTHQNPELTLRSLADQLGIHPNQLSWLLNDCFGKNFNEFINHYRVEAFKKLAVDPENAKLTIMAIANDCGFNSKTVFNTYFKKETGMTPKEFLAR
jgi:TolB-like protein/AraC-like DNA-binding protein/Tfp pilus assembly protein PilF